MIINVLSETIGFHDNFREPETILITQHSTLHFPSVSPFYDTLALSLALNYSCPFLFFSSYMHRGSGLGRLCATVLLCHTAWKAYTTTWCFIWFGSATSFFPFTPCRLIPFYSSILFSLVIHYVWRFPWLLAFFVFLCCNTLWRSLRHFVLIISSFNLTNIVNPIWAEVSMGEDFLFPGVNWDWCVCLCEDSNLFLFEMQLCRY